ncbi:MAG TPA: hypothetical protein VJ816_04800 [Gemmatimonadales bacterium]|nr:hypothetical protein [Gemmatimonadales bacterium]
MASPAIVTSASNILSTPATSWAAVPLPASLVADNLLLAFLAVNVRDAAALTFPAGWTTFIDSTALATPATSRVAVAWKKATGSEGATMTVTNGSTATRFNAITYQVSGAADPTTQAPEFATVTTGSSTSTNAGAVAPTGGSKDYLFFVVVASGSGTSATVPTNYGGRISTSNALDISFATCNRQATTASEDPGAWAISPTNPWLTTVVAVHPPAAAGAGQPWDYYARQMGA